MQINQNECFKYELKDVVDVNDSRQTKQESREMNYQTVYILLEIFSVGFFLILDFFLITLLDVVRVNSEVTFVQEGEHNIQFKVSARGVGTFEKMSLKHTITPIGINS